MKSYLYLIIATLAAVAGITGCNPTNVEGVLMIAPNRGGLLIQDSKGTQHHITSSTPATVMVSGTDEVISFNIKTPLEEIEFEVPRNAAFAKVRDGVLVLMAHEIDQAFDIRMPGVYGLPGEVREYEREECCSHNQIFNAETDTSQAGRCVAWETFHYRETQTYNNFRMEFFARGSRIALFRGASNGKTQTVEKMSVSLCARRD